MNYEERPLNKGLKSTCRVCGGKIVQVWEILPSGTKRFRGLVRCSECKLVYDFRGEDL